MGGALERHQEPPDEGPMTEMLWSDPGPKAGLMPSKRGVGVAFGQDVTERFLRDNDLELLIRWCAGQWQGPRALAPLPCLPPVHGQSPRGRGLGGWARGWRLSWLTVACAGATSARMRATKSITAAKPLPSSLLPTTATR